MATDYSKLTDAEVYERCAKALGLRWDDDDDDIDSVRQFSRAVLDAMVERKNARGEVRRCRFQIQSLHGNTNTYSAHARVLDQVWYEGGASGMVVSDSLDRAICEAALLALEAEDAK